MLKNRNAGVKTMRPFHRFFASLAEVGAACLVMGIFPAPVAAQTDFSPRPEERQAPFAMHAHMDELPRITVGRSDADLMGADNRVLQAAVDYISALGGGIVEIGEGEFLMRDSLHLRSNVTVRGRGEKTVLRKAACVRSPLGLDGDFGEQQMKRWAWPPIAIAWKRTSSKTTAPKTRPRASAFAAKQTVSYFAKT